MTIYFVLGGALVAWALILTALGLRRDDFPPSRSAGRGLVALSAVLALSVLIALLVVTEKEHPREHAKAEAAERKAEAGGSAEQPKGGEQSAGAKPSGQPAAGGVVAVRESEYSIELPAGSTLPSGRTRFEVTNAGKIEHDLAVQGPGVQKKTPLIAAGSKATLEVALKPGSYKLICTVPGHEQLGMKTQVTVK
jgi:uncharacterized cupredoxin-like copper-binding protein